jgi:CDP-glycerol glycerophosphotransferase
MNKINSKTSLKDRRSFFSLCKDHIVLAIRMCLVQLFNLLPIKNNKIFLFSYYGSQYGCNPKYISEYLIHHYPKDRFELVWALDDTSKNIDGVKKVKVFSLRYFFELSTSKVIITNYRTINLYKKRKNQFYIQTWHSSLRLKQIEKDAEDSLPENYIKMAKKDSKKIDLLLSGCELSTAIFKRSFWYDGEIFEKGTPRNDLLFHDNSILRSKVLSSLHLPLDSKVVLYAPTFRKNNSLDVYNLDYSSILEKLTGRFGGNWIFLVKFHPHLISNVRKIAGKTPLVIDVTTYDDIQELLSISDVLISDYSSLIFDYSITRRPCFLYVPDLLEYTSRDRSLYFDLTELPFRCSTSNQRLLGEIEQFDANDYERNINTFLTNIGSFEEGNACEALTKRIDEICISKEKRRITYEAI